MPELPEGVRFVAAAAGGNHTILVRSDGHAVATGANDAGQCQVPRIAEASISAH